MCCCGVITVAGKSLHLGPGELGQGRRSSRRQSCAQAPAGPAVTSFEQLARLAGGPRNKTPGAPRQLTLPQLRASIPLLADAGPDGRAELPGISRRRAEQSLAGALIAETLMQACGVHSVEICPWSTREGLLLERLGVIRTPPHRR